MPFIVIMATDSPIEPINSLQRFIEILRIHLSRDHLFIDNFEVVNIAGSMISLRYVDGNLDTINIRHLETDHERGEVNKILAYLRTHQ